LGALYHPTNENVAPFPAQQNQYPPFTDAVTAALETKSIRRNPIPSAPAAAATSVPTVAPRRPTPSVASAGRSASLNAAAPETPAPAPAQMQSHTQSAARKSLLRKAPLGTLQP
jgi:hypothetical protein